MSEQLHLNNDINTFMLKGYSEIEATELAAQCRKVVNACSSCGLTMDDAIHLILNTPAKDSGVVKEVSEIIEAKETEFN